MNVSKDSQKGQGSFWIAKQAIEALIKPEVSATQINAYLVLAKHTNEGGKFSTAGTSAIRRATGLNHETLDKALGVLMKMDSAVAENKKEKLIYLPDAWEKLKGEKIPTAPFERAMVRYVVNDLGVKPKDRIWISNDLITGHGQFEQPLRKLKMCGDLAAKVLLISYLHNNEEQYGGVATHWGGFYKKYQMEFIKNIGRFDLHHGKHDNGPYRYSVKIDPFQIIKAQTSNMDAMYEPFYRAIDALEEAGFIYEVVSVMDRTPTSEDAQVIYELHTRNRYGFKNKGEDGLAGRIASISSRNEAPVTDSMGRFYNKFAAIVPTGIQPFIVGVFRLRFRVVNIKNYGVSQAWSRIQQGQRDAIQWLDRLEEKDGSA